MVRRALLMAWGLALLLWPHLLWAQADLPMGTTPTEVVTPVTPGAVQRIERAPIGTTVWLQLQQGPFPAAGAPYQDATTIVFVPKHFKPSVRVELLVHFHGHNGIIGRKMVEHRLREQVFESGRNVLLVMPQGPYDAGDSSAGKLEQSQGFARFAAEVIAALQTVPSGKPGQVVKGKKRKPIQSPDTVVGAGHLLGPAAQVGRVALSAHSGGYRAVAFVLALGGVAVSEVWLFDALYGEVPKLRAWLAADQGHRLRSWYTKGAPEKLNGILMKRAIEDGLDVLREDPEGKLKPRRFCQARRLFVHTAVHHGEVPWRRNALRDALVCSAFAVARGAVVPRPGDLRAAR